jgi:RNA polymerase sigma factor (sigma-70 family)
MAIAKPRETVTPGQIRLICLRDVFAYAYRRVPHLQDAEDITAEVFAAAVSNIPSHVHEPRAWLIGIARRKIADHFRKSGRRHMSLSDRFDIPVAGPEREVEAKEDLRKLRQLVDELPEDQREALLLQCVENLSLEEIGVVMKRSIPSIKGLLQRARQTLFDQGSAYFLEHQEVR